MAKSVNSIKRELSQARKYSLEDSLSIIATTSNESLWNLMSKDLTVSNEQRKAYRSLTKQTVQDANTKTPEFITAVKDMYGVNVSAYSTNQILNLIFKQEDEEFKESEETEETEEVEESEETEESETESEEIEEEADYISYPALPRTLSERVNISIEDEEALSETLHIMLRTYLTDNIPNSYFRIAMELSLQNERSFLLFGKEFHKSEGWVGTSYYRAIWSNVEALIEDIMSKIPVSGRYGKSKEDGEFLTVIQIDLIQTYNLGDNLLKQ